MTAMAILGEKADGLEPRESHYLYNAFLGTEKIDIEVENLWFWNE